MVCSVHLRRRRSGIPESSAAVVAVAAVLLQAQPPAIGSTAVLGVTAMVNANCSVSTSALDFGRYESLQANASAPLNAVATVRIACTKGSAPKITMDLGQSPSGGKRYMALVAASGPAGALLYELYQPPSALPGAGCLFPGRAAWGPAAAQAFVPTPPASRAARSYSVCGTIPAGQSARMGSYRDTVVATVNF